MAGPNDLVLVMMLPAERRTISPPARFQIVSRVKVA
jgi:hypothetical protein